MSAIFFIGKRTLFDILRTGVFWVTVALTAFLIFSMLWWGWKSVQAETVRMNISTGTDTSEEFESFDPEEEWNPLANIKPETIILWYVYSTTIGIANLLSIFAMMGLVSREIDFRTIDLLLSRPVTRGQAFFAKLLAGWVSIALFLALMAGWTLVCQLWGGMGIQANYISALAIGIVSPLLIGAIALVFSIWMRGFLAGLMATVMLFASGTAGMAMIKLLGLEVFKLKWPVWVIYKILPPLNVVGQSATDKLESDAWFRFARSMFMEFGPTPADGLYTEMWHVLVYLGIVLLAGWLSFFRRQFN